MIVNAFLYLSFFQCFFFTFGTLLYPYNSYERTLSISRPLINLIRNTPCEILRGAAWTMSSATCGSKSRQIKYLMQKGAIAAFASLLESNNPSALLF